jgi:hypothetical protein
MDHLTVENVAGGLLSYTWDYENRLTIVLSPSINQIYKYSADGLRQQTINSSGTTNFLWDGLNALLETNASQVTQAHYTDNPGYWGGLVSQTRSGTSSFYGFDS